MLNKKLFIILTTIVLCFSCATLVIINNINSNYRLEKKVLQLKDTLKSMKYNSKYEKLPLTDSMFALDEKQLALNIIAKEYNLPYQCRNMVYDIDINKFGLNNFKYFVNQCMPTYKVVKENFSELRIFDTFIINMEKYNSIVKSKH